jgi:signal transduction histidine kinase/CheY-like chemotaxis protein
MLKPLSHWKFSRKVLVPILLIMVALVTFTTVFMNIRLRELIRKQATADLLKSQRMFQQYMDVRLNDMQRMTRSIPTDNRVRAAAQLRDSKTLAGLLQDLMLEKNLTGIAYAGPDGKALISRGNPKLEYVPELVEHMDELLEGQDQAWLAEIDGHPFEIGAAPVFVGPSLEGIIIALRQIDEVSTLKLSHLTGCEIAIRVGDTLPILTWHDPRQRRAFVEYHRVNGKNFAPMENAANPPTDVIGFVFNNEHFLGIRQDLTGKQGAVDALLIAGYEIQLRDLKRTQNTLLTISVLGIALGGCIAGVVIRRVTAPLQSLQTHAEAVGRGEFDRQVASVSQDEFGLLATSFNRMTQNLKQSKEELEATRHCLVQSEKLSALGEFIAGIAHELNNPLTVMVGYSQLLSESDLDDEVQEDLKQVAESADRCQRVVKNLLSFARQRPPERIRIDVNELLDSTIRFMHYELHTSGIKIETAFDDQLSVVMGDSHQLQQVFLNLARNAQHAMEGLAGQGTLRLTTRNCGHEVEIRVQDSGTGIPAHVIDKIFDPFFTSKEAGKGTGLGLSVSYGIIREHGGTIQAESPPGAGALFTIRLPAGKTEAESKKETVVDRAPPNFGSLQRMLVVDDEPNILRMVQNVLGPLGLDVETAGSAQVALQALQEKHFDLILSDWKMPDMNGQDFFEAWKKIQGSLHGPIPFAIMTGDVLNTDMQAYLDMHDIAYLEKPFSTEELIRLVETLSSVPA